MADQSDESSKRRVAARALAYVEDGMKLGLGTGSTAKHFVDLLAERVRGGLDVVGVLGLDETHVRLATDELAAVAHGRDAADAGADSAVATPGRRRGVGPTRAVLGVGGRVAGDRVAGALRRPEHGV